MKEGENQFDMLPMPRKDLPPITLGRYRVYRNEKEYAVVECASALEALQAVGLTEAYKIERDLYSNINVLNIRMMHPPVASADKAAVTEAVLPHVTEAVVALQDDTAVPPGAEQAGAEALSNSDVDKLLNG